MTDLFSMFDNTFKFLGTGLGIFVLVLIIIVLVEFCVIWIVLKILFKVLNKDKHQATGGANEKQ